MIFNFFSSPELLWFLNGVMATTLALEVFKTIEYLWMRRKISKLAAALHANTEVPKEEAEKILMAMILKFRVDPSIAYMKLLEHYTQLNMFA